MNRAALALAGAREAFSRDQVVREIEGMRACLARMRPRVLALDLDNGPAWAIADLAARESEIAVVPLPGFFSVAQRAHALRDSGADWLLSDRADGLGGVLTGVIDRCAFEIGGTSLVAIRFEAAARELPHGTSKITYTSGTTGEPKGVCLGREAMDAVARSLAEACELGPRDVHLCALPLATLLENIGGLYAPQRAGGTAVVLPMAQTGLRGMAGFDAARLLNALQAYRATTAILVPHMLRGLVEILERGAACPRALRFLAVGGAPVARSLLERARACGLPVYEGYGLTECASVVALNTPSACRDGSVGRVLPHARLRLAADGELHAGGAIALGYVGGARMSATEWPTGDLGCVDDDGFVHLTGRRRNMFVTAFGRNVAPEWIERELTAQDAIAQAAVFGEARPWLSAVIVPRNAAGVAAAIARANAALPDYAQVRASVRADEPFTPQNGEITANGRLRRAALTARYGTRIDGLYALEKP